MTVEQAKQKLERLTGRKDPLSAAFHGGRVGFRKPTKKYRQEIDRSIKEAVETTRLREFIDREEAKEYSKNNPKPSPFYSTVDEIEVGRIYEDCTFGAVTVIRRNKSTVTIQCASGYKETRKPHFIYK